MVSKLYGRGGESDYFRSWSILKAPVVYFRGELLGVVGFNSLFILFPNFT